VAVSLYHFALRFVSGGKFWKPQTDFARTLKGESLLVAFVIVCPNGLFPALGVLCDMVPSE